MSTNNPLFDLSGRNAIVTGAGRGLGAEMAKGLASAGADVVVAARTPGGIARTAAAINAAGGTAHAIACDATKRADVEHLIEETVERFGGLDIMVVNHGLGPAKDLLEVTDEDLDAVIGVNLNSAYVCAQLAGKQMIEQGKGGAIVITSSSASKIACWGYSYYGASKGGVDQLVRQLAQEWAPHGIRVNAINPGYTENEMAGTGDVHDTPEVAEFIDRFIPFGRRGRAEEMAGPVVFMVSDAASYMTGQCLFIDGGYSAV
jgi:gluconate 5-dehydrogenase